jgi:hypothetical protein
MDKYVLSGLTGDESIAFSIVEPFDGSGFLFGHFQYSLVYVILGEAVRAEPKKTTQFPQVWAVFDITAKTYFVLHWLLYYTWVKLSSVEVPFLGYNRAMIGQVPDAWSSGLKVRPTAQLTSGGSIVPSSIG